MSQSFPIFMSIVLVTLLLFSTTLSSRMTYGQGKGMVDCAQDPNNPACTGANSNPPSPECTTDYFGQCMPPTQQPSGTTNNNQQQPCPGDSHMDANSGKCLCPDGSEPDVTLTPPCPTQLNPASPNNNNPQSSTESGTSGGSQTGTGDQNQPPVTSLTLPQGQQQQQQQNNPQSPTDSGTTGGFQTGADNNQPSVTPDNNQPSSDSEHHEGGSQTGTGDQNQQSGSSSPGITILAPHPSSTSSSSNSSSETTKWPNGTNSNTNPDIPYNNNGGTTQTNHA